MKISELSDNWPKVFALTVLTALLFWGYGCPPKAQSILHPGKKLTRPELQIELDTIIATIEFRMSDLEEQERIRNLVFKNALVMVDGGTLNPVGVITGLAALYGAMSAGKQVKDRIKKKKG